MQKDAKRSRCFSNRFRADLSSRVSFSPRIALAYASAATRWLRNPDGGGFPGSRNLSQWDSSSNAELIAGTGAHWGVVAALIAVIFSYVLFARHILGFHIRLAGQAPKAAGFAGVSAGRLILICLGVSGMLAGMAGPPSRNTVAPWCKLLHHSTE